MPGPVEDPSKYLYFIDVHLLLYDDLTLQRFHNLMDFNHLVDEPASFDVLREFC